jgi:hypothetical protein
MSWLVIIIAMQLLFNIEYNKRMSTGCELEWMGLACLSLSLMLWPTVSRPVCLGITHPSGAYDQIFITVRQLRVCWYGALSLTRRRVCCLQLLLTLASGVIFGCESRGTRVYIRFETSLFVASYDSQGYGGGIRPRFYMGGVTWLLGIVAYM